MRKTAAKCRFGLGCWFRWDWWPHLVSALKMRPAPTRESTRRRGGLTCPPRSVGRRWTVHGVKRLTGPDIFADVTTVPHWMPATELAAAESLSSTWSCGAEVVVFEFDSGLTVRLEPGWGTLERPALKWEDSAEEGDGLVMQVRGASADPRSGS